MDKPISQPDRNPGQAGKIAGKNAENAFFGRFSIWQGFGRVLAGGYQPLAGIWQIVLIYILRVKS
ncbi:hypothetical protein VSS37_13450 [Candidatus Thiothrix sp. Deng01]|uniref:Uncharacterized protein n=1 Tax=Candidatus Thiothrix phosphatis TaxID=3112415 RepID=A0ABU6D0Y2_9GAMM|nr:hypothetical protein [Candidatus Thiothrix sp. Deng01]MEB4591993.1 hypothetical protein [Candidatus Thiothrix sp. Deng01]